MTNRNIMLGRSKPQERLTREELAALEREERNQQDGTKERPARPDARPASPPNGGNQNPASASRQNQGGQNGHRQNGHRQNDNRQNDNGQRHLVPRGTLKFRWTLDCPGCGQKVNGEGIPQPRQRLARCGHCKLVLVLAGN